MVPQAWMNVVDLSVSPSDRRDPTFHLSTSCLLPKTSEVRWGSPQELIPQPHISPMTPPLGVEQGQKQAANATMFAFIIYSQSIKSDPIESSTRRVPKIWPKRGPDYFFTMIKSNTGNCSNFCLTNVCCVDTTTKSTFEYGNVYFLISELKESNHSYNFEKSNLQVVFFCTFKYLHAVVNNLLLCYHFVVDGDAFSESAYMR